MKKVRAGSVVAVILVLGLMPGFDLLLCTQAQAQTLQIGNLQIPLANLQLVDSNSIPESGTFYMLKDALDFNGSAAAPLPDDPVPQYPVYYLGIDGIYLVANTNIAGETIQQLVEPLFIIPDPNAGPTNVINWPVSPSDLTLAQTVPESATFYLYQDQFSNDPPSPPPYPAVPAFAQSAPIYALSTNS